MHPSPFLSALVLGLAATIAPCMAVLTGSTQSKAMTVVNSANNSPSFKSWKAVYSCADENCEDISFSKLHEIVSMHWNWVSTQSGAWTAAKENTKGTCLVAGVYEPATDGHGTAKVYLSTISRGPKNDATSWWGHMFTKGATQAPRWWAHKSTPGNHAEDGAVFNWETSTWDPARTTGLKIAVWGSHNGKGSQGEQVEICSKCQSMLTKLNIAHLADGSAIPANVEAEIEQLAKESATAAETSKRSHTSTARSTWGLKAILPAPRSHARGFFNRIA